MKKLKPTTLKQQKNDPVHEVNRAKRALALGEIPRRALYRLATVPRATAKAAPAKKAPAKAKRLPKHVASRRSATKAA